MSEIESDNILTLSEHFMNIAGMRDDIHKKAPISAALKGVLKRAIRPADQLRPDRLKDAAIVAMSKELLANIDPGALKILCEAERQPTLLGMELRPAHVSRMQSDIIDHLKTNPSADLADAMLRASKTYIDSACNETEAVFIAEGVNRHEVRTSVGAFRTALEQGVGAAIAAVIAQQKVTVPDHRVSPSERLPLGPRAPGGAR